MSSKNNTLLIDCGNTFLKWCVFDGKILTEQESLLHRDTSVLEIYKELIDKQSSRCKSITMVSVLGEVFLAGAKRIAEDAGMSLADVASNVTLAGVRNGYSEPESLGTDRLVAMVGAFDLIDAHQACIVIDSGTATTIDAIDETGQHIGGVIFPGLELSLNSLSDNTEQLPKLDANEEIYEPNGLAKNTSQAITSGCLLSLAGGIDGICNKMQKQLEGRSSQPSIKVQKIICGGAAQALLPHLESNYDLRENLVMLGLKRICLMESTSNND